MKKPRKTKSSSNQDKLTAHFTTGQLVVAICVTLLFAVTTFLLGVLVGRYDPSLHPESAETMARESGVETQPAAETGPSEASTAPEAAPKESRRRKTASADAPSNDALDRLRKKAAERTASGERDTEEPANKKPRVRELPPLPAPQEQAPDTASGAEETFGKAVSAGAPIRLRPVGERSPVPVRTSPSASTVRESAPATTESSPPEQVASASADAEADTTTEKEPVDTVEEREEPPAKEAPKPEEEQKQPQKQNDGEAESPEADTGEAPSLESEPATRAEDTADKRPAQPDTEETAASPTLDDPLNEDAAAAPPMFEPEGYGIQVASFLGENRGERATAYKKELAAELQCDTTILKSEDDRFYRVVIVGYADRASAKAACAELKERPGFSDIFVRSLSDSR